MATEVSSQDRPFKVIIVGAGIGGLILAHSLDQAGIDYVVLDKHPVAPAWGGSFSLHPSGTRTLHQLGILETLESRYEPMGLAINRGPDGKDFSAGKMFDMITDRNGYYEYTLERRAFLQILYDTLPEESKPNVIENARVRDITEDNGTVEVTLADGTVHEGDLVVGADGVHSAVREIMWAAADKLSPGLITTEERQTIKTTYKCLIGVAPRPAGFGKTDMISVSNDRSSFLMLMEGDTLFFIAPYKLPSDEIKTYPDRPRYTDADAELLAAELADRPLSAATGITFGDIWHSRTRGHLVSLEEGVLSTWFHGRTVLCGDSAHKMTPNAAFGGQSAMESAVVLANELTTLVRSKGGAKPSDAEIQATLQRYQDARLSRVKEIYNVSWMLTRLQAYDGWLMYLLHRWILPVIGMDFAAKNLAKACSDAPYLWYVPYQQRTGTLPWKVHKYPSLLMKR
ncbi:hypothetical protein B0T17DRAFT_590262 [Bombardia bombarda]|uniref:FAD-binding domain-containing protein n=1 Tax=Bombardia bombarda TaxID=252184 RepID=A0AA40CAX3_9PEZI|nr:hypothetical protein B0T17DRAFT_590262 [Bombardia bombarda]